MKHNSGFTIIELVVILIILGILAVTAAPRLLSDGDFSAHALRDQLISQLRLAQLQALSDQLNCYQTQINGSNFGIYKQTNCTGSYVLNGDATNLPANTSVAIGGVLNTTSARIIRFDGQGRPAGGNCVVNNLCTLTITANEAVTLCVESEGYIHDC